MHWDGKKQIFGGCQESSPNYLRKLTTDQERCLRLQQPFMPMWDTDAAFMAISNLLTAILYEYGVNEATAASDLDELLEKLSDVGVLVVQ